MDFDAVQRTIGEIILTGEHIVPRYQRPYAWDEQNIIDLWNDLENSSGESHFLGNMVVHPSGDDRWDIVDGQQRLTTILIAIRAIMDAYETLEDTGRAEGLGNYIQRVDLSGNRAFRIQYRTPDGFLHLNILSDSLDIIKGSEPVSDAEKAQYLAYEIFSEHIARDLEKFPAYEKIDRLDRIRDRFLRATVVYVRVDDRQNAFKIFETLNDRGKSLNQIDLVKNQVISSIPATAAQEEEMLWDESLRLIGSSTWSKVKAEDFLGYVWNSTGNQDDNDIITNNRIRRSVESFIRNHETVAAGAKAFILLFHQTAEIFGEFDRTLASPNGKHWEEVVPRSIWRNDKFADIDSALYGCLVPGSNLPLNLLFSLLRNYIYNDQRYISKARLVEFLNTIESLQFRWSISQRPSTSTIRRAYRRASFAVDSASSANDVRRALEVFQDDAKSLMPTDMQFKDGLRKLTYFTQRPNDVHRVRRTLQKIDAFWGSSKVQTGLPMTLEHIESQGDKSINSRQNFWIGKLGNLMLLPMEINSRLPQSFAEKCEILCDWVNPNDQVLIDQISHGEWNNASANQRMEDILDAAVKVWPRS